MPATTPITLPGSPVPTASPATTSSAIAAGPPRRTGAGGDGTPARGAGAAGDEALEAARAFEKLLIHDMLKTMRRTAASLGEEPSNGRATYDDMLDERLAGIMSEGGGLGLATALAGQLRGSAAGAASGPEAAATRSPNGPLSTDEVLRLRALVRPGEAAARDAVGRAPGTGETADGAVGGAVGGGSSGSTGRAAYGGIDPFAVAAPDASSGTARERAFIAPLLPHARSSARRLGTSPDAVLAIAALESGWGRHVPRAADGASSHNLFGIKARAGEAGTAPNRTTEYVDGRFVETVAAFRTFDGPAAAVDGFADFVLGNPRYAAALEHAGDPPEFLRRLHAAGYATDPRYADKAIALMQRVRVLRESLS